MSDLEQVEFIVLCFRISLELFSVINSVVSCHFQVFAEPIREFSWSMKMQFPRCCARIRSRLSLWSWLSGFCEGEILTPLVYSFFHGCAVASRLSTFTSVLSFQIFNP